MKSDRSGEACLTRGVHESTRDFVLRYRMNCAAGKKKSVL